MNKLEKLYQQYKNSGFYKFCSSAYKALCIMVFLIFLVSLILGVFTTFAVAKDFKKQGLSFEIKEESFVAMIKRRIGTVDIKKHEQLVKDRVKKKVNNPKPVANISKSVKGRVFYYDPTYVLNKDAVLSCGKILYKAGTSVNPLHYMDLERRMFFIDGSDEEQLKWVAKKIAHYKSLDEESNIKNKVILTSGSVFKTKEYLGIDVYFDQFGHITGKFGIKHVPSIAEQEELRVKIEEIVVDDEVA